MVYTEGDIHLENICLMKNLLNVKKVKAGVSKEYIVKNKYKKIIKTKRIAPNHYVWVVLKCGLLRPSRVECELLKWIGHLESLDHIP